MSTVLIPYRNSALGLERPAAFHLLSFAINHDGNHREDSLSSSRCLVSMLNLQCHSEGAFWRGLVPLFGQNDMMDENSATNIPKHAVLAVDVLVTHYEDCMYSLSRDNLMYGRTSTCDKQTTSDQTYRQTGEELHRGSLKQLTTRVISDWLLVSLPNIPINTDRKTRHLLITIYPPNPMHNNTYYSRTPSSRPTNTFTLSLIACENSQIRLQSISAYLSTLGGGYFLCHHLSTALLMAKKQCEVARLRGDEDMVWRCRINMGYCCFYAGKLKKGRGIVQDVLHEVVEKLNENDDSTSHSIDANTLSDSTLQMNDYRKRTMCNLTIIKNMCLSALWFADRVREAKLSEEKNGSVTHDDYKRIRVVRDRSNVGL